ncbi:MAG: chemotaxis protein CheX [Lachnospiraceae bacterium]|nr:chemotaxis protein CheX [Lachnospiraceae bacterium]
MFINLFGKYLISKNIITSEQLQSIRKEQSRTRVKLGLIAVAEKLLTEKQAEEINRKQALMDKRFGDIAIEQGFLTLEQVSHLLDLQGNPYLQFGQIATERGYMTFAQIEDALQQYQNEHHFSEEIMTGIKNDDLDVIIPAFVHEDTIKEAAGVAIRTLNRLISTDLWMGDSYMTKLLTCDRLACQDMEGDLETTIGLAGMGDSLLSVADAYAGESFQTVDMDALDSVGEVVNIMDGLYATALSEQGKEIELLPPSYFDEETTLRGEEFGVIPLEIRQKPVMLVISYGSKIYFCGE